MRRKRERKKYQFVIPLVMYSLVDSCRFSDQGSHLQLGKIGAISNQLSYPAKISLFEFYKKVLHYNILHAFLIYEVYMINFLSTFLIYITLDKLQEGRVLCLCTYESELTSAVPDM